MDASPPPLVAHPPVFSRGHPVHPARRSATPIFPSNGQTNIRPTHFPSVSLSHRRVVSPLFCTGHCILDPSVRRSAHCCVTLSPPLCSWSTPSIFPPRFSPSPHAWMLTRTSSRSWPPPSDSNPLLSKHATAPARTQAWSGAASFHISHTAVPVRYIHHSR